MTYVFLADGFEEIEALGTVDILRRCGLAVQTLSVTGRRVVEGAHGLVVKADSLFRRNHMRDAEVIVIPGGLKGAQTLYSNQILRQVLIQQYARGTVLAAICAGPIVLDACGLLEGRHMTCYPSMETQMECKLHYHSDCYVVCHDNVVTAAGPAATRCFAFTLAERFAGAETTEKVKADMLFSNIDIPMNRAVYYSGTSDVPVNHFAQRSAALKSEGAVPEAPHIFQGADADDLIF